jgi:hypothetical protein
MNSDVDIKDIHLIRGGQAVLVPGSAWNAPQRGSASFASVYDFYFLAIRMQGRAFGVRIPGSAWNQKN